MSGDIPLVVQQEAERMFASTNAALFSSDEELTRSDVAGYYQLYYEQLAEMWIMANDSSACSNYDCAMDLVIDAFLTGLRAIEATAAFDREVGRDV